VTITPTDRAELDIDCRIANEQIEMMTVLADECVSQEVVDYVLPMMRLAYLMGYDRALIDRGALYVDNKAYCRADRHAS
jgi:hypothetical protein